MTAFLVNGRICFELPGGKLLDVGRYFEEGCLESALVTIKEDDNCVELRPLASKQSAHFVSSCFSVCKGAFYSLCKALHLSRFPPRSKPLIQSRYHEELLQSRDSCQ